MDNKAALQIIYKLLREDKIKLEDAAVLLEAIPGEYDAEGARGIRRLITAGIDFGNITIAGRKPNTRVTGSDIVTDRITVRELEAALRRYWKTRERSNAQMGRVMAILAAEEFIDPLGKIEQAAAYLGRVVGGEWDARQIRRAYSETMRKADPELKELKKLILVGLFG